VKVFLKPGEMDLGEEPAEARPEGEAPLAYASGGGLRPTWFCPPHDAGQHDVGTRLRKAQARLRVEPMYAAGRS